jgi:DNA topoisomerase-2
MKNAEIITLMGAIGLEIGKSPIKIERGNVVPTTLRYGNISILTDADHDGSAIRCLLINFFYRFWPELFLHKIISISEAPLYGVEYKGRQSFFYTVSEYEKYIKSHDGCRISYYKGLGSCSTKAWDYFINSNPNMYNVIVNEKTKETLEMVFGEDSDKRKEWLRKV